MLKDDVDVAEADLGRELVVADPRVHRPTGPGVLLHDQRRLRRLTELALGQCVLPSRGLPELRSTCPALDRRQVGDCDHCR